MTKVYIVTYGDYSAFHNVAAFSSKEKAEKFRTLYEFNDRIEVFELNEHKRQTRPDLVPYTVWMTYEGEGEAYEEDLYSFVTGEYQFEDETEVKERCPWEESPSLELRCKVLARDKEHALKITNERRAQLIALDKWESVPQERTRIEPPEEPLKEASEELLEGLFPRR